MQHRVGKDHLSAVVGGAGVCKGNSDSRLQGPARAGLMSTELRAAG
jgi:hypothetical protein